jgi:hypothetical protein
MNTNLKFVLCESKKAVRENLSKLLNSMGSLFLEAECSSYSALGEEALGSCQPDLVVIGIDENKDEALAIIRKVAGTSPRCGRSLRSAGRTMGVRSWRPCGPGPKSS